MAFSEEGIVKKCLEGDSDAFGSLVALYKDMVYGVSLSMLKNKYDAEDVTHEVFIRVYKTLPQLKHHSKLGGWLYSIVKNLCRDYIRRKSNIPIPVDIDQKSIADQKPSPAGKLEEKDEKNSVRKAMESLSDTNRLTTTLYYIDGYAYKEISSFLGIPMGTVKSRLNQSIKKLKEVIMEKKIEKVIKEDLEKDKLKEEFVESMRRLARFPRQEPEIVISGLPDEKFSLKPKRAPGFFTGFGFEDYVVFYDWPEKAITSFAHQGPSNGKIRICNEDCWRIDCWEVEDPHKCSSSEKMHKATYVSEWYYAKRGDYFYLVGKNFRRAGQEGKIITPQDKEWNERAQTAIPDHFDIPGKIKFLGEDCFQGPPLNKEV